MVTSPSMLGYRGRARLTFRREGESTRLGYFAAGSKTLVDVPVCEVLHPALALGLTALRKQLAPCLQGEGEVALGLGAGGACVAEISSRAPQTPQAYAAAEALVASWGLLGIALRVADGAAARFGDPRQVSLGSDGAPLWAPAGAFRQANPEVNAKPRGSAWSSWPSPTARSCSSSTRVTATSPSAWRRGPRAYAPWKPTAPRRRPAARAWRSRGLTQARVVCAAAVEGARGQGGLDVVVLEPASRRGERCPPGAARTQTRAHRLRVVRPRDPASRPHGAGPQWLRARRDHGLRHVPADRAPRDRGPVAGAVDSSLARPKALKSRPVVLQTSASL